MLKALLSDLGALDFVGFTDVGKSITSITLNAGNANIGADYLGVDDVRFLPTATSSAPEPSSIGLTLCGAIALGFFARRRRAARS